RRRGFVSRLLVQALVHRAALLRAARHPIPLRWRAGPLVDGGDRRSAGVSPRPRRRALGRYRAQARPCLEIRRPARPRPRPAAPAMGRWMARAGRELLADTDAIVAVPLHWRRQWARRFNQSALLAEIIAKASGRTVAHGALKRVKATPQQVGLDKSKRAHNVQGAFRVPAHGRAEVTGRKLVL